VPIAEKLRGVDHGRGGAEQLAGVSPAGLLKTGRQPLPVLAQTAITPVGILTIAAETRLRDLEQVGPEAEEAEVVD
jgi:hypothetical protein